MGALQIIFEANIEIVDTLYEEVYSVSLHGIPKYKRSLRFKAMGIFRDKRIKSVVGD